MAPVILWSEHSQGNVYLAAKNTFLDFSTDEKKAIKRNACARSASCDSSFKETSRCSTATPTNRSHSPSQHSLGSSDKSPNRSPRTVANNYHYEDANYHYDASYDSYDQSAGGYPWMMVPMMMPMMMPSVEEPQVKMSAKNRKEQQKMPCVDEPQQEVQKKEGKPHMPFKKQDLKELNTEPVEEMTTLMVRGIPCSFSQDTLMKLIDNAGMKGKYDFFYLPRAGNNGSNLGYAFINFTDGKTAEFCMATFNGVPLDPSRSMKICTISPGDIQGLANLRKHFRRTAVSRGSRGPVFLKVFSAEDNQE